MIETEPRIDLHMDSGVLRVVMIGEIDLYVVEPVLADIAGVGPFDRAVVDMTATTFVDSTAIRLLITLQNTALPDRVTLQGPTDNVRQLLAVTGIAQLFAYEP